MYYLQSEKTVKTLWHNEDHWYISKEEGDPEQSLRHPTLKTLCFRVKSIYCYKLLSVRELGRKPTIGYTSYSIMWKFMKPWSTVSNAFCKSKKLHKQKLYYLLPFQYFQCRYFTCRCAVDNFFFWNPNCFYIEFYGHSKIPLAFMHKFFIQIILSKFDNREMGLHL